MTSPRLDAPADLPNEVGSRGSCKRKALPPPTSDQGISPTGGLEFFANKSLLAQSSLADPTHPAPMLGHAAQVIEESEAVRGATEVPSARGKGKGGTISGVIPGGSRTDQDLHGAHHSQHESLQFPQDTMQGSIHAAGDLRDQISWSRQLLPPSDFHVVVCDPAGVPVQLSVRPGATGGQLTQAEAGLTTFEQPIVVTVRPWQGFRCR